MTAGDGDRDDQARLRPRALRRDARRPYVNPLRPGGIAPYVDATSPTVVALFAARGTRKLVARRVAGAVDLLVDTYDTPPPPLPAPPWNLTRVAPALIRWRLVPEGAAAAPWHTAVDFRSYLAPRGDVRRRLRAVDDAQPARPPARLVYYLARGWDSTRVPDGRYRLQVAVFDSQGNSARAGDLADRRERLADGRPTERARRVRLRAVSPRVRPKTISSCPGRSP